MEVAAYASLLSLSHFLNRIQHSSMHRLPLNASQIVTLHENVHFLQEFLEVQSSPGFNHFLLTRTIEDLARRIAEVAYEVESVIDSHVVDQIHGGYYTAFSSSFRDIDTVIGKIDSIKKELLTMAKAEGTLPSGGKSTMVDELDENDEMDVDEPRVSVAAGSSSAVLPSEHLLRRPMIGFGQHVPSNFKVMVGFDDHLFTFMYRLTSDDFIGAPNNKVMTIVGMGGIGKTTLAMNCFHHPYIVEHFHLRVWFTISQKYRIREILVAILHQLGGYGDCSENSSELGKRIYQSLSGRKYLIVMDDVWSTEAWDDVKWIFPNDRNGSRIMVTTRLSNVAHSVGTCSPYSMDFLDEDKSWNLFCEKAFGQESCSVELEEPGKKIAKSCGGLPLLIVVIGGFLAKSNMTREYWEFVAENVNYDNLENDEQCLRILALSYQHLPIHLKPCFLYMRVFPENYEVQVSKLINLWIAEGLLKPSRAKSLDEVAEEYLKDLIDRNLIFIRKQGHAGKIKTCGIHSLLRHLCMRESPNEPTFCVPKVLHIDLETREKNPCFLCSDKYIVEMIRLRKVILGSRSSPVSTWVCNACRIMYPQLTTLRFMNGMLEVDVMPIKEFPQPTTSRYLTVNCDRHSNFSSFSSIHLLWNLQTLIFYGCFVQPIVLPSEIWEMPQLRHIKIRPAVLPYPAESEKKHYTILENLDTLSEILDFRFSMGVLKRIPNMKKLRITYFNDSREDWSYYSLYNLVYLSKLESLYLKAKIFSSNIIGLPHSLKKLVLNGCRMPWEDMTVIGSLPNLEVLKLNDDAFEGPEWDLVEGEFVQFVRLKLFSIGSSNLVQWRAEKIHFPCLETLVLEQMHDLEEIPPGIGEIDTLQSVHLAFCSDAVINSAKQILEEQLSMGIDDLQLYVTDDVYWRRRYEISPPDSEEEDEEYDIKDALVKIRYLWET